MVSLSNPERRVGGRIERGQNQARDDRISAEPEQRLPLPLPRLEAEAQAHARA